MRLLIRDVFPQIKVETTKGAINLPKDYDGKWFVLFSHPADTDTVRAVIIVDHVGRVRATMEYPKEIGRNIDEILRTVEALKMASIKKVFAPANWPHNEIIGDKVLFHRTEEDKPELDKERGISSLSDWFVYKNMEE